MMRKWPKVNLSSKTRLIAIVVIALLLPTVVLSAIQFRSLVDLEDKTKVAVQENIGRLCKLCRARSKRI